MGEGPLQSSCDNSQLVDLRAFGHVITQLTASLKSEDLWHTRQGRPAGS
jgi:hypothetical protein